MAVLKKLRSRLLPSRAKQKSVVVGEPQNRGLTAALSPRVDEASFDVRPLTIAQLNECWRLDQRCFSDGEAYSRDTFEYLLTAPESVSYRVVTVDGMMVGFVVGLIEADNTGHITTVGVAPEYRRRKLAHRLMEKVEEGFRRRNVRVLRLEVRSVNHAAQHLYSNLGFVVTQRLPRYYANGGDGLLMVKSLEQTNDKS